MKKSKLIIITVVASIVIFSGCNNDTQQEDILGKWKLIAYGPGEDSIKPVGDEEHIVKITVDYLIFLSDGKVHTYYQNLPNEFIERTYKIDLKYLYFDYNFTYELGRQDYMYKLANDQLNLTHVRGLTLERIGEPKIFVYQKVE